MLHYNKMDKPHNLDLNAYSLDEIFALFGLSYDLTEENMKMAKKKVLMLHPDKSQLPSVYFLFYKQAYEVVLDLYRSRNKINAKPSAESLVYNPIDNFDMSTKQVEQIRQTQQNKGDSSFSTRFNRAFDENVAKKVDPSRHEWFKQDNGDDYGSKKVNPKNMGEALESLKQKQQAVAIYKGVAPIRPVGLTSFYDGDDDNERPGEYIECDVFSKLKFEDLRKVHRDQIVTDITQNDLQNMQTRKYDSYLNSREKAAGEAMNQADAMLILEQQRKMEQEELMRKQQRDIMLQKEMMAKQRRATSTFLHLGN